MPRTRTLVIAAAICAVASAGAALEFAGTSGKHTATAFLAVAGLAAATALVKLLTDMLKSARDRKAVEISQVSRAALQFGGRFPRVQDIADPVTIGVHPAAPRNGNRVPEYVRRDCDDTLRTALARPGFILLVGDAAAGKSRTAFEAIREELPRHLLVDLDPDRAAEIPAAIDRVRAEHNCVLWLDNLQAFLTDGSITRKDIAEICAPNRGSGTGHHRVVVATLRAVDEARLTGQLAGRDRPDPLIQAGQGVVEQATERIFVERLFSAAEQARAGQVAPSDDRIADALRHADRDGIGEYLAWGPQLYSQWETAWARASQPRAAALIAAAVDCRRAGFAGPLPRALLEALHEDYLAAHGGQVLSPESVADAWQWALAPRESGSAPLRAAGPDDGTGRCEVFEYLVDEYRRRHEAEPAPERVVLAALDVAVPDQAVLDVAVPDQAVPDQAVPDKAGAADAGSIAATAWQDRRYKLAKLAAERQYAAVTGYAAADALEPLVIRSNLTTITLQLELGANNPRQLPVAEQEYRDILAGLAGHPEADPVVLLRIRSDLAAALSRQFKLAEAGAEFRQALADAAILPPDDPVVVTIRTNRAIYLAARTGDLAEAETEFRAILDIIGPSHPDAKAIGSMLADVQQRLEAVGGGEAPRPL